MEHYPADKVVWLIRTPERCREKADEIGPACAQVVAALLDEPWTGPYGRPLDNRTASAKLIGLVETVGAVRLEAACRRALHFGDPRYRRVKTILAAGLESEPLPGETQASAAKAPARAYTHARRIDGGYFEEVAA